MKRHTDVWLVRHTQTDWNRQRRYQSRSDRPLTAFGVARAEAAALRLRRIGFSAVVSSGQARTDTLAALVAERRGLAVERDPRWREADHGDWEGLTYPQVAQRFPEQAQARFADSWASRAHGGEASADLWERLAAAWDALLSRNDGGKLLIVAHATPIQLLLCRLLGLPFERYWQLRIDLGGICNVDLYASGAIVRTLNEVPALRVAR